MDVYSRRLKNGDAVWYCVANYWSGGKRRQARRTTGVRDDGTAKSRRTAEINARDIEQSLALGENRVARPTTLTQAIDALVEKMETARRAQPTIDIVLEKAVHLFDYFGANLPAEKITEAGLQAYAKAAFTEIPDVKRARKPGTVDRELRTVRQALKAVGITPPPMPDLGKVYVPRERFLTQAEQLRLLAAMPPARLDDITMYLHMGLSKGELSKITAADCDFKAGRHGKVRVRGTKAEKRDRVIPMTPDVHAVLLRRVNDRSRKGKPLFNHWWRGNADKELRRWSVRAGLGEISFNDLRRTFATQLAAKGVPLLHLMHLMGHSSTKMLEQIYARVGQGDHMDDAIAELAPLRSRTTKPKKKA